MKLTDGPLPVHSHPARHDPDYDDPRPLDWDELLNPILWLTAVLMLAGLWAFMALVIAVMS